MLTISRKISVLCYFIYNVTLTKWGYKNKVAAKMLFIGLFIRYYIYDNQPFIYVYLNNILGKYFNNVTCPSPPVPQ